MFGQPYFCKHLYACLARETGEKCPKKLLDLHVKIMPSVPNELRGDNHRGPLPSDFNQSKITDRVDKLIEQSHIASQEELFAAENGTILKLLHDGPITGTNFIGRSPRRMPHKGGHRRKGGPINEPKYVISLNDFTTHDPYMPKVLFPENTKSRHGGRAVIKACKRGKKFEDLLMASLNSLGDKIRNEKDTEQFSEELPSTVQNDLADNSAILPDLAQLSEILSTHTETIEIRPQKRKRKGGIKLEKSTIETSKTSKKAKGTTNMNGKFGKKYERKINKCTNTKDIVCDLEHIIPDIKFPCPVCHFECKDNPGPGEHSIGCDSCNKWYHFLCVKLKKEPPKHKSWHCPNCA